MHKEETSPRKGGELIKDFLWSDQYVLLEVLKDTAATKVFHVRHRSLNTDRIIKVISLADLSAGNYLEADLIKNLHHPSIPVIYDLQQLNNCIVIFEEYIGGQSLYDILLSQNSVSEDFLIWTANKLCDVMAYLHSRKQPILYQDLKPEHIFYQDNELRLIDFGISEYLNLSEIKFHYGTKGYAAPEQYTEGVIDEGVDIYAFGKVIEEISLHITKPLSEWIITLIKKSIKAKREERFNSFEEIKSFIFANNKPKIKKGFRGHLPGSIAVAGSQSGVGVTHLAISLVACFRSIGIPAVYKDFSQQNNTLCMEEEDCLNTKGAYGKRDFFLGELEIGPGIDAEKKEFLLVKDYGTRLEEMIGDLKLYVVGGRYWQISKGKKERNSIKHDHIKVVCNQGTHTTSKKYASYFMQNIFLFPTDKNPFTPSRKKLKFCKRILSNDNLK